MDAKTALRWALAFLALSIGAFLLSYAFDSSKAILQIKEAYIIDEHKTTIPEPKNGETFYLESLKNCDEILSAMRCELVKIDTLKYDKRVRIVFY